MREQRIYIFAALVVALISLAGIALLINRNKLSQRMKEMELRNRIAADLHDEVGSSLSSIHLLSHMAKHKENGRLHETLQKITNSARETMDRMSDIVWAIQPGNDSIEQLIFRMKEFIADILDPLDIHYEFFIDNDLQKIRLDINQRRDLYLIFKEAVNNISKYSNSKNVEVHLRQREAILQLRISDDGTGFELSQVTRGNGLNNMQQRARQLCGSLDIDSLPGKGATITLNMAT